MDDINLEQATLPALDLSGTFTRSIHAKGLKTNGDIRLRNNFRAQGQVYLAGATIGGYLDCSGGRFIHRKRIKAHGTVQVKDKSDRTNVALQATGMNVAGNVLFSRGFEAVGVVSLYGEKIGRELDCKGGTFINPGWVALNADQMEVQGCVFQSTKESEYSSDPQDRFRAYGQVRLIDTSIGGNLDCRGGSLKHLDPHEPCLRVERIKVGGDVLLSEKFHAQGKVNLTGASIDGSLRWEDVDEDSEVDELDLRFANLGTLHIDPHEANWPHKVILYGLEYSEIGGELTYSYDSLIGCLNRQYHNDHNQETADESTQSLHSPQPYEQMAEVLSEGGNADMAKRVLVEMNNDRRRCDPNLPLFMKLLWYNSFGRLIGYGYYPFNALYYLLGFIIIGAVLFRIGHHYHIITLEQAKKGTSARGTGGQQKPKDSQNFSAFWYSLDTLIPKLDLGYAKYWVLDTTKAEAPFKRNWLKIPTTKVMLYYRLLHILMGWCLTPLFLIGLTGLIRT